MKISCPSCKAAFALDDKRVPPAGLSIKCPKCKSPFVVQRPKPGEEGKIVEGRLLSGAVPLPAGSEPKKVQAPPSNAVPLPGSGEGTSPQGSTVVDYRITPPAEPERPQAVAGAVPLPGTDDDFGLPSRPPPAQVAGATPPDQPAVPLPGAADDGGIDLGLPASPPPPPPPSMPPPSTDLAGSPVPLPGSAEEPGAAVASPPAKAEDDPFAGIDVGSDEAPQGDQTLADHPPLVVPVAFDGDFPVEAAAQRPATAEDPFGIDLPPPPPPAAPPPAAPVVKPFPADAGGLSFDFVEAPHAPPSKPAPQMAPSVPASPGGPEMLDFVDDDQSAVIPKEKSKPAGRAPPTMSPAAPGQSKAPATFEDLAAFADDRPAAGQAKGASSPEAAGDDKEAKKRKKAEEKERKKRERDELKAAKAAAKAPGEPLAERLKGALGPVGALVGAIAGSKKQLVRLAIGLAVVVFVALGLRAGRTGKGYFWSRVLSGAGRMDAAATGQALNNGHAKLAEGTFASTREAVGIGAQLVGAASQDEDARSFFVLASSELKVNYGQTGADWDQAKRLVEQLKGAGPAQGRARAAFALASGDLQKARTSLAGLAATDVESAILYAQALVKAGEAALAAQMLDNALKRDQPAKMLLYRGQVAKARGQVPEAAAWFEKTLEKVPTYGRALVELADVRLKGGDLKAAGELLDRAQVPEVKRQLDATEEGRASMLRAKLFAAQHLNKEAEAAFGRAITLDPASGEIHGAAGLFRLERRDYERAAKEFDSAIDKDGSNPELLAAAATAFLHVNRYLDADKRIREALQRDPGNPRFITIGGRVADAIGKGDEAVKEYERALAKKPDLTEALLALSQVALAKNDKEKARERLELAVKAPAESKGPLEHEAIGDLWLAFGENEKSKESYETALKLDPEDAQAYGGLGRALAALGDLAGAKKALGEALARAENDASLQYENGSLLRKMGDLEGAAAALKSAVKLSGKDPRTQARYGAVLVEQGDFAGAEAVLRQSVLMNDKLGEGLFFLGRALTGQHKLTEAVELLKRAIDVEPDNGEYLYHLGLAYEAGAQVNDAVEAFARSIAKRPTSADAQEHLGQNLVVQNRFDDAVTAFQKAAQLDPKRARLWAEVGDAMQQAGDLDGAISHFVKSVKQEPGQDTVWTKLGVAYKDKGCDGCKAKAIEALKRATQINPKDAQAYYELGYIYKDDRKRAEALTAFRRYVELKPDAPNTETVKDDIFYLQEETKRAP